MPAETADRPVIIRYLTDVEPSTDHPSGHRAGQTYECASAAIAEEHHPEATIVGYAGGGAYPEVAPQTPAAAV